MKRFKYSGFNQRSESANGVVVAETFTEASILIETSGIVPESISQISEESTELQKQTSGLSLHLQNIVEENAVNEERQNMYGRIGRLLESGYPILEVLRTTSEIVKFTQHKELLIEFRDRINKGESFSNVFSGKVPRYELTLINIGEETGNFKKLMSELGKFKPNTILHDDVAYVVAEIGGLLMSGYCRLSDTLCSIEDLFKSRGNHDAANVLNEMKESINSSNTFSETLSKFPKIFSPAFIAVMKGGELEGSLNKSFVLCKEMILEEYRIAGMFQ